MGISGSVNNNSHANRQPLGYLQTESSDRVSLCTCDFRHVDPDVEHHFPDYPGPFFKAAIRFEFLVNEEREILRGVYTRDPIYSDVVVGQPFPLKRTSELKTGMMEELGVFEPRKSVYSHSIELYVPKSLGDRRLSGFLLDGENIVLAKVRGVIATETEFEHVSEQLESRLSVVDERLSRTRGIQRLSKMEQQKHLQNVVSGLTDTLNALSSVHKSRVEFLEAKDGTKLAYRTYIAKQKTSAVFILLALNCYFHEIIAHQLASCHPVTAYILEVRGFGYSGGPRGYAPSKEQIWMDIKSFIKFVKMNQPGLPVFLGGHYHEGGLVLNYSGWRDREPVDGYAFVSPNFGTAAAETLNQEALSKSSTDVQKKYLGAPSLYSMPGELFGAPGPTSPKGDESQPVATDAGSSNIARACNCTHPKKYFQMIDRPFGLWVGEKEELLIAEKLIDYPRKARISSSINVLPNLTHLGVLNVAADHIGKWILTLDAVNRSHLTEATLDISDIENYDVNKPAVLKDAELVVKSYLTLKLNETRVHYLPATDGTQIEYRVYMPVKRPLLNILFLQSDIKVVTAWMLANKFDAAVYVMDLRGIDNSAPCYSREFVLNDVKILARYVKLNNPELPILLGGHGYGASCALNYSAWKHREHVNGYLFISPIVDMRSNLKADRQLCHESNMKRLFSPPHAPSWFSSKSKFSAKNPFKHVKSAKRNSSVDVSQAIWDAVATRNVQGIFKCLGVPFGLWLGSLDEIVDSRAFAEVAEKHTSRLPFREVTVIPHATHLGNIILSTAYIVPFLKQFCKIVAPSLSFKLRNPKLDDFEKLQFIGKGSFGRVYLVKHRVSEKYFAMKVLNKIDIVEANEVQHVINEKIILRDMNSSYVVSFVGSFQDTRHLYILMEYVIGGELFTQLSLRKRFSNDVARFYAAEVVLFFEDIHSKNIIYRDLKPENILLDSMGHIRVTDFGFAKYMLNRRTHTFCGTPQYIAPEIIISAELGAQGYGYGIASDYYSLGILIYEMLVGQTPFNDQNVRAIYRRILYGVVEFPWSMDANAKDIIRRLMTRDPLKRLGSNGVDEIKRHRWFAGIDWGQLRRREITAPFVPKFSHAGDTSNFIPWGKDTPSVSKDTASFEHLFRDF